MRLDELARRIEAQVVGDGSTDVTSVATLDEASPGQIGFVSNQKYLKQLDETRASAVIVADSVQNDRVTLLKTKDPYYAFMQAVVILHGHRRHPHPGVHPSAHIDPTARLGAETVIYPGVFVGARVRIGRQCIIYPNVTIYDDSVIGDRVIIHAGSAIGVDGFGFATHKAEHHKIPQVGNVVIENDVELGANCAIERGAIGSTRIGRGTKVDGLVVIGHGSRIGPHCLIVAQTGVAGSVTIGHHATVAGQVGIAGHLTIGDNATIAARAGVMNDIEDQSIVMGTPAMPVSHARRVYTLFMKLPDIVERIKTLEEQVQELSDTGDTPIA
ncbi:MAG: UDP-3-O-(3-hydroxymyristoyl)glucosamine N-acyltransferase [Tepidisphaeraceae bacterium]